MELTLFGVANALRALDALEREHAAEGAPALQRRAAQATVDGVRLHELYTRLPASPLPGAARTIPADAYIPPENDLTVVKHPGYDEQSLHTHEFFEIVYLLHGTGCNHLEDRSFPMREGDVFFMRPGVRHLLECRPGNIALNLIVRERAFSRSLQEVLSADSVLADFCAPSSAQRYLWFETDGDREIRALALALLRESILSRPYQNVALKSLLLNLCGFLLAGFGKSMHVSGALPKSRLNYQHIRAYLLANYRTATLEGTARHMFFSQRHLGRIVKENCGKSFTGLLAEIRLEAACGLLRDTALSVSEVGWACGFRDPGYFIRMFRRAFGMTPAAWRARRT